MADSDNPTPTYLKHEGVPSLEQIAHDEASAAVPQDLGDDVDLFTEWANAVDFVATDIEKEIEPFFED